MVMKVLFIDHVHNALLEKLVASGHECHYFEEWSTEDYLANIGEYDGLVIRSKFKLTAQILSKCKHLKFIARFGAGMENIDVQFAESRGIRCLHAPEGNRDAVGEHALAMLLTLFNNIVRADGEVRRGIWEREGNRGIELAGKTVGIIGYGNMGAAFARKLRGFDCEVLVYDKYKKGFSEEYIKEVSLETLQKRAQICSIHVQLTPETKYMVNESFLNAFAHPIYLINTARGQIVDTMALVNAIKNKKVAGACLDVSEFESVSFEKFDFSKDNETYRFLIESPQVVLTPHIAGWTHESNLKMALILADKILALAAH